jgi:hypothetical protein
VTAGAGAGAESRVRAAIAGVVALGVVSILVGAPRLALACAVCSAGREDENQTAFLISTIFMSLLPLAALGTLVYVLWRRYQKLEQADAASIAASDRVASSVASPASPAN